MITKQRLKAEIRSLAFGTLYFTAWIGVLIALKTLILAEYRIGFSRFSMALVGALILTKVVLVLEHVPLGKWTRTRPAWVDVVLRTILYGLGVCVVLVLEKAFEGRHEHGGFGASLMAILRQAETPHALANAICISGALLGYNALHVVQRHLGKGGLIRVFLTPLPEESEAREAEPSTTQPSA